MESKIIHLQEVTWWDVMKKKGLLGEITVALLVKSSYNKI